MTASQCTTSEPQWSGTQPAALAYRSAAAARPACSSIALLLADDHTCASRRTTAKGWT